MIPTTCSGRPNETYSIRKIHWSSINSIMLQQALLSFKKNMYTVKQKRYICIWIWQTCNMTGVVKWTQDRAYMRLSVNLTTYLLNLIPPWHTQKYHVVSDGFECWSFHERKTLSKWLALSSRRLERQLLFLIFIYLVSDKVFDVPPLPILYACFLFFEFLNRSPAW